MNAIDTEQFVNTSAQALGLALDAGQLQRVAAVFGRNALIAQLVLDFDLPESTEAAPVFTP